MFTDNIVLVDDLLIGVGAGTIIVLVYLVRHYRRRNGIAIANAK